MRNAKSPESVGDTKGNIEDTGPGLSRRAWLGGAAMIAGFGATCVMTTSAAAKAPQASVKYEDQPQGKAMCGTCAQFEAPDGCKLVDGKISPNGWCQLYTPKAG